MSRRLNHSSIGQSHRREHTMRNRIDARTTILKILDLRVESSVDEDAVIFMIAAHQDDPRCGLRTAGKLMRFNTLIVSTRRAARCYTAKLTRNKSPLLSRQRPAQHHQTRTVCE